MPTYTYTFYVELNDTNKSDISWTGNSSKKYWQGLDFGKPTGCGSYQDNRNCPSEYLNKPSDRNLWVVPPTMMDSTDSDPPPKIPHVYFDTDQIPYSFDSLTANGVMNETNLNSIVNDDKMCILWTDMNYNSEYQRFKCSLHKQDIKWRKDPVFNTNMCTRQGVRFGGGGCDRNNERQGNGPYRSPKNFGPFIAFLVPIYLASMGGIYLNGTKPRSGKMPGGPICNEGENGCAFFSNYGNSSEGDYRTACPGSTKEKWGNTNYYPICSFGKTWDGKKGCTNLCGYVDFTISWKYYKLKAYTDNPGAEYTIDIQKFNAGYYSVSPLSPSSDPTCILSQNMSGFPSIKNIVKNYDENDSFPPGDSMNFDNIEVQFQTADTENQAIKDFCNNYYENKILGIWKVQYTLDTNDFLDVDFKYKLYDFMLLQQDLYNSYSAWFRSTTYWNQTLSSIRQIMIDFCNTTQDMENIFCSAENLNFSFLPEPPCSTDPLECIDAWSAYCDTSSTFFSPLCQYIYSNSYNQQNGTMNANMENILNNQCQRYYNDTSDHNLTSDFLSVCGCYLPQSVYDDITTSENFKEAVGGYDYRQCWYSPCIYSNVKPQSVQTMQCKDNDITNCVQRTIMNFSSENGNLYDNNVIVNTYANGCGGDAPTPEIDININETTPPPTLPPNDPTLPPLENETPTPYIVNTNTSEKPPEIKQNFVIFFKWKEHFTAISIVIGAVLVVLVISLRIKKFNSSRQKKSPKVNVNISNV